MTKIYLDCDGVILNSEEGLFDKWYEMRTFSPDLSKREYLYLMDWEYWLNECGDLNDALNILRFYDPKSADILTKVHSINEGRDKVRYFRNKGIKNNIIIVPDSLRKPDVVEASGNILVDDSLSNLDDWNEFDGIPIGFGSIETEYPCIDSLEEVLDPMKVKRLLNKRN